LDRPAPSTLTYLRPFLETYAQVTVNRFALAAVTLALLMFGHSR
jgi:hypothetical protein